MSMITELLEKLRNLADEFAIADTDTMEILDDATYVIEELSTKLKTANMERSSQYYNGGSEKVIEDFKKYQIDWLKSHNDIEFCPKEEELIVGFLNDTAECYIKEYVNRD